MNNSEFCKIWNESESLSDVAVRAGKTKAAVATRANKLRGLGWNLKKFPFKKAAPLQVRFWSFVNKTDGCWIWTGSTNKKGYGQMSQGKRGLRPLHVHRVSWEIHNGQIPDDQCVLHRCDNPACVRPDHLFLGTEKENTRDMMSKERGHWQRNAPRKQLAN